MGMLRFVTGSNFSYYTKLFTIYGKKEGEILFLLLCRFAMCSFRLARHVLLGIRDELGSDRLKLGEWDGGGRAYGIYFELHG